MRFFKKLFSKKSKLKELSEAEKQIDEMNKASRKRLTQEQLGTKEIEARNLLSDPAFSLAYIDLFNDRIDELLRIDVNNTDEIRTAVIKMQALQDISLKLNLLKTNPHKHKQ